MENQAVTAQEINAMIQKAVSEAVAPIIEGVNTYKQAMSNQGKQTEEPEPEVSEAVKQFLTGKEEGIGGMKI